MSTTNQTILEGTELQALLSEKKQLERVIEHYREEFRRARTLAKENKHKLKEINIKIWQITRPEAKL